MAVKMFAQNSKTVRSPFAWKKWVYASLVILVIGFGARMSMFRITKNFHVVDEGKFYRSAQLSPEELDEAIKKYGIRTVISLRGEPEQAFWLAPQKEVLAKNNVRFVPLWWTTDYLPDQSELRAYLREIINPEAYPILIHCRSGSDRTGAASAIYAREFLNQNIDEAISKHLNFNFWYVEWIKPRMVELVRRYKGVKWGLEEYDPCMKDLVPYTHPSTCHDKK
jgi:protein tyrosine/serine phosphatase